MRATDQVALEAKAADDLRGTGDERNDARHGFSLPVDRVENRGFCQQGADAPRSPRTEKKTACPAGDKCDWTGKNENRQGQATGPNIKRGSAVPAAEDYRFLTVFSKLFPRAILSRCQTSEVSRLLTFQAVYTM